MVGPDRGRRLAFASAISAAVLALTAGCSGNALEPTLEAQPTEAKDQIERTKQAAGSDGTAALPEPSTDIDEVAAAAADANPPAPPVDRTQPVHFPTQSPEAKRAEKPTLYEASEAERRRRQEVRDRPAATIITDENLREYAKGGQLTELVTEGLDEKGSEAAAVPPASRAQNQETYWRTRVRDSRLAWRAGADRVEELKSNIAQLRFDFYASDDPAYRDLEIKPAWDRAAVELTQAQLRVADLETQVQLILEEGLEAGALPGWLREGLDFEPESADDAGRDEDQPGIAQSIEPPIMDDPPK